MVLSDALWRGRFGADPSVVGRTLSLGGVPRTVVGVLPPSFRYPPATIDAWIPAQNHALTDADVRDFVEWFWWTGMRPGEIRQLSWSMLDRETWTLNLSPKADKTCKWRVLVTGPLREIVEPIPIGIFIRGYGREVP